MMDLSPDEWGIIKTALTAVGADFMELFRQQRAMGMPIEREHIHALSGITALLRKISDATDPEQGVKLTAKR